MSMIQCPFALNIEAHMALTGALLSSRVIIPIMIQTIDLLLLIVVELPSLFAQRLKDSQ
jgi:hypothetical protein